jgi:hypothetical protein
MFFAHPRVTTFTLRGFEDLALISKYLSYFSSRDSGRSESIKSSG